MANRSHQRRSLRRRQFDSSGGCGIPEHHCARGLRPRVTGRGFIYRTTVDGGNTHQPGLFLRTGDQTPEAAHVRADGEVLITIFHSHAASVLKRSTGISFLLSPFSCDLFRHKCSVTVIVVMMILYSPPMSSSASVITSKPRRKV